MLTLLKLQEMDREVERLERRLARIGEERNQLREELEKLTEERENLREREEEMTRRLRTLRESLAVEEDLLEKTERKMLTVRKEHEYRALLREKAKHEDNILKMFYEIEELEKDLSRFRGELDRRLPSIDRRIKEIEECLEDLKEEENLVSQQLKSVSKRREEEIKKVEHSTYTFYNEAKKRFGSTIIAKIEEGSCTGCGMKVPDVLFSRLLRENSVERCPNCGRYIYYRL